MVTVLIVSYTFFSCKNNYFYSKQQNFSWNNTELTAKYTLSAEYEGNA